MILPLVAVMLAAEPPPADALARVEEEQTRLYERLAPSVVSIRREGGGEGSGFFVSRSGLILTNRHVVGVGESLEVLLLDGRRLPATVLERGQHDVDVALVKVALTDAPAVVWGNLAELRIGSWLGTIGHGHGQAWTFTSGHLANALLKDDGKAFFGAQVPVSPGNSGGPLFDRSGRVVGLATGRDDDHTLTWGISASVARAALTQLEASTAGLVVSAPAGVPIFVDGIWAGVGPWIVVPLPAAGTHDVFAVVGGQLKRQKVSWPDVTRVALE